MWTIDKKERVCGNCAHWQEERGILGRHGIKYAPCALDGQGVELCDAPGGMALMNPAGNCRSYGDCWDPSEAYLEEIHYAEDARQAGERPGMATLREDGHELALRAIPPSQPAGMGRGDPDGRPFLSPRLDG